MSNLQSQLLLTGAAFMACLMVAQAVPPGPPILAHTLGNLGLFGHPSLLFPVHPEIRPGVAHPAKLVHPAVDINKDGIPDVLDANLDGKVDKLPLFPIKKYDENNDRIPDKLDLNRDGKVDAGFTDVVLGKAPNSLFLFHAEAKAPVDDGSTDKSMYGR